jgi:hypothetical protein
LLLFAYLSIHIKSAARRNLLYFLMAANLARNGQFRSGDANSIAVAGLAGSSVSGQQ